MLRNEYVARIYKLVDGSKIHTIGELFVNWGNLYNTEKIKAIEKEFDLVKIEGSAVNKKTLNDNIIHYRITEF